MTGDKLSDYPCADYGVCNLDCDTDENDEPCRWLAVYRAHITLRAAVLGDMTPEEAKGMYRSIAMRHGSRDKARQHFFALANMVAKL